MSLQARPGLPDIVFYHVPKCAGMAVRASLQVWERCYCLEGDYDLLTSQSLSAETAAQLRRDSWQFAFVRNPWARIISAWFMFRQKATYAWPKYGGRSRTLEQVVDLLEIDWNSWSLGHTPYNYPAKKRGGDANLQHHLQPATRLVPLNVNFVGYVGRLPQDWAEVQIRLGEQAVIDYRNRSHHQPYREYFTPVLRERVARIYAADIERFGFQF